MADSDGVVRPSSDILSGLNIMVMGPSGSGKTYSIHELVDYGFEVFYLALENGLETLTGYYTDKGLPIPPNLHWHQVRATNLGFKDMIAAAKDVNMLTFEMLLKKPDPNKSKFTGFVDLLTALSDFPDDRTGKKFGAVDDWGTDRWIVIDSLTGINTFAMQNTIGGKAARDQKDWGLGQAQVENLLRMLTDGSRCHFYLISHIERELDPVLGGTKIMASTLGKALAPKLPTMFSELILAERAGDKWQWITNSPAADTKSRYLSTGIHPPSFKPILDKWVTRGGVRPVVAAST